MIFHTIWLRMHNSPSLGTVYWNLTMWTVPFPSWLDNSVGKTLLHWYSQRSWVWIPFKAEFFSGFVFTAAWWCNLWWWLMSSYLILGSSNILSFIYLLAFFTSKGILHTHKLSCQLPVGLIAQLVGHCTSIHRGHGLGLNPVQARPFSSLETLPLLINNWHNYNDCLCLYIFLCSSKTWLFKYSFAN